MLWSVSGGVLITDLIAYIMVKNEQGGKQRAKVSRSSSAYASSVNFFNHLFIFHYFIDFCGNGM